MTPDKKRVMHFIDSGGLYGAESVLLNLSGSMKSCGEFEPVVGCIVPHEDAPNDLYDKAQELDIRAEKIVIRNTMLMVDLPRAARQLKRLNINLIHSHGYKPSVFGYVINKMSGIEVMATCHLWFKGSKGPLKMRVMVALELYFYKKFKTVVGVSEPIKTVLIEAGVPANKIQVVENGVVVGDGLKSSPEVLDQTRADIPLSKDEFCILNTGRLTQQKAQWDIISAAKIIRDRCISCRFLIVGEGGLKDELQEQIKAANLGETVELLGFRDDISELLQIADLFVLPSLDEGMPMSLLEAAALGLPIISTPVGDIPKLIVDQVTGLVINKSDPEALANAIVNQMENLDEGKRMGAAARQRVQESYSTEVMYAKYARVYSGLV